MGQAQSLPEIAGRNPNVSPLPLKKKTKLKVPSEWKNDADFLIVSPVSDISNPSQFRGRHVQNNNVAAVSSARRNRTSKVCSKQRPPTMGLPPPKRFYFQGADPTEVEGEDDAVIEHNVAQKVDIEQKRSLTATWKAKCTKAKQQFTECFQTKLNEVETEPHCTLRYSQRANHGKGKAKEADVEHQPQEAYLQLEEFEPVWKEQSEENARRSQRTMLHSEDAFVHRLAVTPEETPSPCSSGNNMQKEPAVAAESTPPSIGNNPTVDNSAAAAPSHLPSVTATYTTGEHEDISPPTRRALSLSSGQAESVYQRSLSLRNSLESSTTGVTTVLQQPRKNQILQSTQCTVSSTSTVYSSSSGVTTVLQPQNAPASNGNNVFRPKIASAGAKQAEIFRQSSSTSTRQRASIGRASVSGVSDVRRSTVQEQVQRQIDDALDLKQKPVSRVQRLRQQYQQELEKMAAGSSMVGQQQNRAIRAAPTRGIDRYSIPTSDNRVQPHKTKQPESASIGVSVAEKRRVIENRASSVPGRVSDAAAVYDKPKGYQAKAKSTAVMRRSISAPRSRPSVDGSALLHLTGWNSEIVRTGQNQHRLPVLLQVAGWQKNKIKVASSQREDLAATRNKGARASNGSAPTNKIIRAEPKSNDAPRVTTRLGNRHSTNSEPARVPSTMVHNSARTRKTVSLELPRREPPNTKSKGRTVAFMLQQAYFNDDDSLDDSGDENHEIKMALPGYDRLALQTSSSPITSHALVACSPAVSVDSVSTTSSVPMVSDQATFNSEFLFYSDAQMTRVPTMTRVDHGGLSLTTLDSRSRMTAFSGKPVTIPASSSASLMDGSNGSVRRVRFSEEILKDQTSYIEVLPDLESKLSDLTDTTGSCSGCDGSASLRSSSISIPRIDSIPEEEESPLHSPTILKHDEGNFVENIEGGKATPQQHPKMRWSYRTEGGYSQGVTPLLGGKNTCLPTNSPYLRFKDAKEKFASVKPTTATKKILPCKRSSPVKRTVGNLVTSRVAAMEGRRIRSEGGITTKVVLDKKPRRNISNQDVLAPCDTNLVIPFFNNRHLCGTEEKIAVNENKCSVPLTKDEKSSVSGLEEPEKGPIKHSPMFADDTVSVVSSPNQFSPRNDIQRLDMALDDSRSTSMSSDNSEDVFGAILHPNTIDEDSNDDEDVSESDGDDFDQLLNYEGSEEEASVAGPSVATVLQPRARSSVGSTFSTNTATTEAPSVATVLKKNHSMTTSDVRSIVSFSSSIQDTASTTTTRQNRRSVVSLDENSIISAVGRMKSGLVFREEAAPVKPTEQNLRAPTGALCLSPMQRTPMQARKWRALAAAAQEKDSKRNLRGLGSLSECNPNTIGR